MKRSPTFHSRSAAGLIEILIVLTLTGLVLGGVVQSTDRGLAAFKAGNANNEIESRAGRAMGRLTRELMGAGSGSLRPNLVTPTGLPKVWSSSLDFRVGESWAAGGIVWTEWSQFGWELAQGELDNDLDDNGDGLVDEGSLVFIQNLGTADEIRVVLASGVSEWLEGETANGLDDNGNGLVDETGLVFDLDGDVVNVRFSLERIGPNGNTIIRTQETSLRLRNSGS